MPKLTEMDGQVSLFAQIEANVGPVILINTFTVKPEEADDLLKAWAADAAYMKQQPGVHLDSAPPRDRWELGVRQLRGLGVDRALQASIQQPRVPIEAGELSSERGGVASPFQEGRGPRHLRGLTPDKGRQGCLGKG